MVPYDAESGNYERHESKTGVKTVAMEGNSMPPGLPLSEEGVWPAPTNEEQDALCKVRTDCMGPAKNSTLALRSYNAGAPPPNGQRREWQRRGTVERWPLACHHVASIGNCLGQRKVAAQRGGHPMGLLHHPVAGGNSHDYCVAPLCGNDADPRAAAGSGLGSTNLIPVRERVRGRAWCHTGLPVR